MKTRLRAFTLIELLVVVAIIALLISILLPSLAGAREQAKKSVCLANLSGIGKAASQYASEDPRENVTPIHISHVTNQNVGWSGSQWWWRTAGTFAYAGKTATVPFPTGNGPTPATTVMMGPENNAASNPVWGADKRPLNKYIYGAIDTKDTQGMEAFRCPSDKGMPDQPPLHNREVPIGASEIPFFDMVGNSYRLNVAGMVQGNLPAPSWSFSVAPWGHRLSALLDVGKLVTFCEPMFYTISRQDPNGADPDLFTIPGSHNVVMNDNVAFADGSARPVRADQQGQWSIQVLRDMNYTDPNGGYEPTWFLRRGRAWRTDSWPTPGVAFQRRNASGAPMTPTFRQQFGNNASVMARWPFRGYSEHN